MGRGCQGGRNRSRSRETRTSCSIIRQVAARNQVAYKAHLFTVDVTFYFLLMQIHTNKKKCRCDWTSHTYIVWSLSRHWYYSMSLI